MNDGKIQLDKEQYLQPQTHPSLNNQNRQPSLPKAPPLQFQRYPIKKESDQKIIEKSLLVNTKKENNEIHIQKSVIQYPLNIDKVTDYGPIIQQQQQLQQPLIQLYSDFIDLQKDYINTFQPRWVNHMLTNVENYQIFQNKMILLCLQNCNIYLKSIFNTKLKEQKKDEARK